MNQHETLKKIRANFLTSGFLHCTVEDWERDPHPEARVLIGTEIRNAQEIAARMAKRPKQDGGDGGAEETTRDPRALVVTVQLPAGSVRDHYADRYFPMPR